MLARCRRVLVAVVVGVGAAGPVQAAVRQGSECDTRRVYASRAEVEALLPRLDSTARARAASEREREEARRCADRVRARLAAGDFQPGDRVLLRVEGEQQLSDTFTVDEGRVLRLPAVGAIPLAGVLRGELEDYLGARLGQFIRDPVVHARALIRVGVVGEVSRPGFYLVSPTGQVADVLMAVGGPTQAAKLGGMTVERGDGAVWQGETLRRAIAAGQTLDELGIRSGDQFTVPRRGDFARTAGIIAGLVTIPVAIYTATRIF